MLTQDRPAAPPAPPPSSRAGRGALVAAALLAVGLFVRAHTAPAERFPHAMTTPMPRQALPAVQLQLAGRTSFGLNDLAGHWVWLYLGYSHCPDVCPTALGYLAGEYRRLQHPDAVRVLFVSVDPARDTPATLAAFTRYFEPHFLGATGSRAGIDTLVHALGAQYVIDRPKVPGGDYAVSHSNLVYLLDPGGRLAATYLPGTEPGALAGDTNQGASS